MGRELHEEWPVFRETLEQAFAALDVHMDVPLRDVMWAEPGTALAARLDETGYTQPALFALEVAVAALWRSWGVEPDLLAGHSIGELAAAYVAGVFSLEDAARLVAARGRLMQALPVGGAMVSIAAAESAVAAEVLGLRANHPGAPASVSIGAVNGPQSVVISGAEAAVLSIAEGFSRRGVRTKRLPVSHAFHSPLMEPMLEEFRRVAESVTYRASELALISNVTGALAGPEIATSSYWVEHVRATVRFGEGVRALHEAGATRFLELGPRPTLLGLVPESLPAEASPTLLASMRIKRTSASASGKRARLRASTRSRSRCSKLWVVTMRRAASSIGKESSLERIVGSRCRRTRGSGSGIGLKRRARSRVWGKRRVIRSLERASRWQARMLGYESSLSLAEQPWLGDHRVAGQVFVPGAGLCELVRAAAENRFAGEPAEVLSLVLQAPLVIPEDGAQRVQVVLTEEDSRTEAKIYSQRAELGADAEWTLHATAEVRRSVSGIPPRLDLAALRARCTGSVDVEQAYEEFAATGLSYGPSFQGMRSLLRGAGEALAEVMLPAAAARRGDVWNPSGAARCGVPCDGRSCDGGRGFVPAVCDGSADGPPIGSVVRRGCT